MAAGVNGPNKRDAGDLVFRRTFAAPIAELFGRPIKEPKFPSIAGVDDGFTAKGLGGGGELFVLLLQGVRKGIAAPGEINAVDTVFAFPGERRRSDALEEAVEADNIAGLGIVFPAVDVNEDEKPFAVLRELPDFRIGMTVLLKIEVIAALVELNKRAGGRFAIRDWTAFDIPGVALRNTGRGIGFVRVRGTQSVSARGAADEQQGNDSGCQNENNGTSHFRNVPLHVVL